MTTLGLWIDDSAASLRNAKFWDEIERHGFKTAALMLEGYEGGWNPKYSLSALEQAKNMAFRRDIEIVLTVWPEPAVAYLNDFEKKIGDYLDASGAAGLEFDAEGNWLPKRVRGFKNLDLAGDRLVEIFREIQQKHKVRTELTTYPYHAENSAKADIAVACNRLLPQAYSVRSRTEGAIEWDDNFGPGRMQRFTLDRALMVPGDQGLSCGLAAYDQTWPGKRGEEAMRVAYAAALKYKPLELRYWSSKWVLGHRKNGYASRFFLNLKG